jgi:hypothetical protein
MFIILKPVSRAYFVKAVNLEIGKQPVKIVRRLLLSNNRQAGDNDKNYHS